MSQLPIILLAACGLLLPALLSVLVLRRWLQPWWNRRWVRLGVCALPVLGLAALLLVLATPQRGADPVSSPFALLALMVFFGQCALLAVLPISALILQRRGLPPASAEEAEPLANPRRRLLLQSVAAALPLAAVSTSLAGVATTAVTARVSRKTITLPRLPKDLVGLRILHLTDLHLGGFMTLARLAEILAAAKTQKPHLVVVTGDIADDLSLLGEALVMIRDLAPELGVYVTLGNHEYGNGIGEVRRILAQAPVRLLFNEGVVLNWRGAEFYLAGVDDSAGGLFRRQHTPYLATSVAKAMAAASPDQFAILLSHRPEAFDTAAPLGADLTLAGHTHGGQLGLAGKSALILTGRIK